MRGRRRRARQGGSPIGARIGEGRYRARGCCAGPTRPTRSKSAGRQSRTRQAETERRRPLARRRRRSQQRSSCWACNPCRDRSPCLTPSQSWTCWARPSARYQPDRRRERPGSASILLRVGTEFSAPSHYGPPPRRRQGARTSDGDLDPAQSIRTIPTCTVATATRAKGGAYCLDRWQSARAFVGRHFSC
jgi:hypothetical protein